MDCLTVGHGLEGYDKLDFIRAKLMVNDRPYNVVALHFLGELVQSERAHFHVWFGVATALLLPPCLY